MTVPDQNSKALAQSAALEQAHGYAVNAAIAGLQDPALAGMRLCGSGVPRLADAAVSSATPFVRAPLLARISAASILHPQAGNADGDCGTCGTKAPCPTAEALQW
jgi:hypothetical protein